MKWAEAYRAELQERLGIRQAEVVTARELGEAERGALVVEIGKLAGSRVEASFKLDKSILGGTVVRIGSTVYGRLGARTAGTVERSIDSVNSGQ